MSILHPFSGFRTTLRVAALVAVSLSTANVAPVSAQAVRAGFDASDLGNTDDGSLHVEDIGFTLRFFGYMGTGVWVNNNGNMTFGMTFEEMLEAYSPIPLHQVEQRILAPYFADVDTRESQQVTYGAGVVDGRAAFGVNWLGVGYFDSYWSTPDSPLNYFQLILIDRGLGDFDFEFNYAALGWDAGDADGGIDGLGIDDGWTDCARVGWGGGATTAGTAMELDGSGVCEALIDGGANSLARGGNTDVEGRYRFHVRNGVVTDLDVAVVPEPSTLLLATFGGGVLWIVARRRRTES